MLEHILSEAQDRKDKYVDNRQAKLINTKGELTQEQESVNNLTKI